MTVRALCAFAGHRSGRRPAYAEAARTLGAAVAARGWTLVTGGGRVGLMGAAADGALAAGGEVIGIIPHALLDREIAHDGLTELRVVASMHERKAMMAKLADAFVALPGGYGTLEELFEVVTWAQLGLHRKPFGVLEVGGFHRALIAHLDHCVAEGFIADEQRSLLRCRDDPDELLDALAAARVPPVERVIDEGET